MLQKCTFLFAIYTRNRKACTYCLDKQLQSIFHRSFHFSPQKNTEKALQTKWLYHHCQRADQTCYLSTCLLSTFLHILLLDPLSLFCSVFVSFSTWLVSCFFLAWLVKWRNSSWAAFWARDKLSRCSALWMRTKKHR